MSTLLAKEIVFGLDFSFKNQLVNQIKLTQLCKLYSGTPHNSKVDGEYLNKTYHRGLRYLEGDTYRDVLLNEPHFLIEIAFRSNY